MVLLARSPSDKELEILVLRHQLAVLRAFPWSAAVALGGVALVLGLVVPDALAPDAVVGVARFCAAYAVLPLGFFMLGVNMMAEREEGTFGFPPPLSAPVGVALVLRLAVAPGLLFLLSSSLADVPDAYLLQAGMASGINSLIVGHLYGLDLRLAASTIAWSTALAVALALILSPII